MHMSELQTKEIIDISSGKRVGSISDLIVDSKGNITKLLLDKKIGKRLLTNYKEDTELSWSQIIKIGDDIILVDTRKNN
jgi:YlmC/YmxH family sporulation protein